MPMSLLAVLVVWTIITMSIISSVAAAQLPDMFSWDIDLDAPDFPTFNFTSDTIDKEIGFQYTYTGTYSPGSKYFDVTVLAGDCLSGPAATFPEALEVKFERIDAANKKFLFNLDIIQSIIQDSSYWTDNDDNTAEMVFCVRVDYLNANESVNFHETIVTATIDLSAGFQATNILTERSAAMETGALQVDVSYDIIAYFCDAESEPLPDDPVYYQGSVMQVCVRIDDALNATEIYVKDILNFNILQYNDGSGPPADPTAAIVNGVPDELTLYDCATDGRCNVMHQLTSKFFDDVTPGSLEISGAALLAFGNPAEQIRFLKANIRGARRREEARELQANEDQFVVQRDQGGSISDFALISKLAGREGSIPLEETSEPNAIMITAGVIGALIVAVVLIAALLIHRQRKEEEDDGESSYWSCSEDYSTDHDDYDLEIQPSAAQRVKKHSASTANTKEASISSSSCDPSLEFEGLPDLMKDGIFEKKRSSSEDKSNTMTTKSEAESKSKANGERKVARVDFTGSIKEQDVLEERSLGLLEDDDDSIEVEVIRDNGRSDKENGNGSKLSLSSTSWGSFNSLEGLI
jgi:hypothetical protein